MAKQQKTAVKGAKAVPKPSPALARRGRSLLLPNPPPVELERKFNGHRVRMLSGHVRSTDIFGYADNDRIALQVARLRKLDEPTNDQLYRIMLDDPEMKIQEMAASIKRDAVKVPLILGYDGELLDGNRRYYGNYHLLKELREPERREYETLPVHILIEEPDDLLKESIIVECNYVKETVPWPDFVKARRLAIAFSRLVEAGESKVGAIDQLAERFDETPSRLKAMLEAYELVDNFITFHDLDKLEPGQSKVGRVGRAKAEDAAHEGFPRFEESRNKLRGHMGDPDFQDFFFKAMARQNFITSFKDIREIQKICQHPDKEAIKTLYTSFAEDDPKAIAKALYVIAREEFESEELGAADLARVEKRITLFTGWLGDKVGPAVLSQLSSETVDALRAACEMAVQVGETIAQKRKQGK